MISLLDKVSEPINIHCLHNNLKTISDIPEVIFKHKKLNQIIKYEFNHKSIDFPNLDETHISEATYYRLFIDQYVNKDVDFIVYIDADMICISDPIEATKKQIELLKKSNYCLSAKTELKNNLSSEEISHKMKSNSMFNKYWPFQRLGIDERYFNAGFMILNLNKWKKDLNFEKLMTKLDETRSVIVAWDQDVLNGLFNGKYLNLPPGFNRFSQQYKQNSNDDLFIHFYGSKKPWTVDGVFINSSEIYQNNYRKLYNKNYHIKINWKRHALKLTIKNILNLNILKLSNPISYLFIFISKLLEKASNEK